MKPKIVSPPKIFNDPVYGFITIADPLIQQLIDHPYFHRLGRIGQGGLSFLVYPGAHHTRFHHALGAMYLMQQAIDVLRTKGTDITDEEAQGAKIAILLHDVGHGPYSHTLEHSILEDFSHEEISLQIMQLLNEEFHLGLQVAIDIFTNKHPKKFLHKLVSSQLDVDRLDYLMRDSFYTGVAEGVIGGERIIKMMNVVDGDLVLEEKGIYSVEKFLIARRLMYWQVYLHKTVLGAETLLIQILKRARELAADGKEVFATSVLKRFLYNESFASERDKIMAFTQLDDFDVFAAIKEWTRSSDYVLATLSQRIMDRRLYKVLLQTEPFQPDLRDTCIQKVAQHFQISPNDAARFVNGGKVSNLAYDASKGEILILKKSGQVLTIFEASDNLSRENLSKTVTKHYLCFPKEILPIEP